MSLFYRFIVFFLPVILTFLGYIFNKITFSTIIILYFIYCTYQNINSRSYLSYKETEKNKKIIEKCKILKNKEFKPHFFLPNSFLQIVFMDKIKGPDLPLIIERKSVNGFGTYLDWVKVDPECKIEISTKNQDPVLLILPGLTGSKNDMYVMNISFEGLKNNYHVAIYQNRLLSEKIVLPSDSAVDLFDDLDSAIDLIQEQFPKSKIFAVGFSYGANKIVHYLGLKNIHKRKINAAVSVGNPYDMLICQRLISESIFEHFILDLLKKNLNKTKQNITESQEEFFKLEIEKAEKCKNLKDFDESITRRVLGYKSADDYYRGISCVHHMRNIDVPLLCISSLDDNITSAKAIPFDEVQINENIILLVTDKGGHLCYIGNENFFKLKQWVNEPIMEFINTVKDL
jgi:predicted alpha/beta-fold hydrolase